LVFENIFENLSERHLADQGCSRVAVADILFMGFVETTPRAHPPVLELGFGSVERGESVGNQKSNNGDDGGPNARVGSVIKGKWTIESLLGVGGMAAVYAASHRNGQRAALKILHTDFSREKVICERFLREAYVSNKVNHGATVQVLDDD